MTMLDPHALRRAFGRFMTGVTVVTCKAHDGTPLGFTANSFSSVSLDPPLLLVCPGKFLSSYASFAGCTQFAVNVLAEGQESIASTFASYKGDRFATTPHSQDRLGNLMIDGALAQFSCKTFQRVDAGDHAILIGAVQAFTQREGRGLGYADGQFFSLGLERAALDRSGTSALCGAIITNDGLVLLEKTRAGYRPPQVETHDRSGLRQTLVTSLASRGLSIRLGPAYSVFDEAATQCSYYLAKAQHFERTGFEAHPIAALPQLSFASPAIKDMMARFALEAQTHSFGLYIGDALQGDVHHHLPERT